MEVELTAITGYLIEMQSTDSSSWEFVKRYVTNSDDSADESLIKAQGNSGGGGTLSNAILTFNTEVFDASATVTAATLAVTVTDCYSTYGYYAAPLEVHGYTLDTDPAEDDDTWTAISTESYGSLDDDVIEDADYAGELPKEFEIELNDDGIAYINEHLGEEAMHLWIVDSAYDSASTPSTSNAYTGIATVNHATSTYKATLTLTVDIDMTETHWSYALISKPQMYYQQGETVQLKAYTYSSSGEDITATSATITIFDEDGTELVSDASMTCEEGYVYYNYNIASDADTGRYTALLEINLGEGSLARTNKEYISYEVVA